MLEQSLRQLDAAVTREPDVDHGDRGPAADHELVSCVRAPCEADDVEPLSAKELSERLSDCGVVVDDDQAWAGRDSGLGISA
jgi:hypothetical protein